VLRCIVDIGAVVPELGGSLHGLGILASSAMRPASSPWRSPGP